MADHALKAAMRLDAVRRRDGLDLDDRLEWDQQISDRLLESGLLAPVRGVVAGYWPMRSEADPRPIMVALKEQGVSLALPAMHRPAMHKPGVAFSSEVLFRPWMPWEPLVPGGFGTLVPMSETGAVEPAVLLVPLLAFDRQGRRLGYGKGHYDRAIARLQAGGSVLTIGVAYAAQEVAEVPTEPHDKALDAIVTERGVIVTRTGKGLPEL